MHPITPVIVWLSLTLAGSALAQSLSTSNNPSAQPASKAVPAEKSLFLIERTKTITDSGIVAIAAGTPLEVLSKTATGYKVKVKAKDGTVFEVKAEQVTNDPAKAQEVKLQAAAVEAESKAKRDAIHAAAAAKRLEQQKQLTAAAEALPLSTPAVASPSSPSTWEPHSSLDDPPKAGATIVRPTPTPRDYDRDRDRDRRR